MKVRWEEEVRKATKKLFSFAFQSAWVLSFLFAPCKLEIPEKPGITPVIHESVLSGEESSDVKLIDTVRDDGVEYTVWGEGKILGEFSIAGRKIPVIQQPTMHITVGAAGIKKPTPIVFVVDKEGRKAGGDVYWRFPFGSAVIYTFFPEKYEEIRERAEQKGGYRFATGLDAWELCGVNYQLLANLPRPVRNRSPSAINIFDGSIKEIVNLIEKIKKEGKATYMETLIASLLRIGKCQKG